MIFVDKLVFDLIMCDLDLFPKIRVIAGKSLHAEMAPVNRSVAEWSFFGYALRERLVNCVVRWLIKQWKAVALTVLTGEYTVRRCLIETIGPDLEDEDG